MRQCEFKKRYDPGIDMYVTKHIHGEGIIDVFKTVGNKLFGKTAKSIVKTAAKSAATKAATTTGEYAGKKAGDKIVELLRKLHLFRWNQIHQSHQVCQNQKN